MRRRIVSIEIGLFAHATEDPEKVVRAFRNILPHERVEEVPLHKKRLKGDYGNPIIYYRAKVTKPDILEDILKKMGKNLPQCDRDLLNIELERRLDRGNLYIRLDKQSAYLEKYKICNADPIHLKIRFRTSKINEIRNICKDLGMLS
ncbi:hypothetical protein J7L00_00235 [Candidatus Bathyarchaeota archaeon]|nr:hypothetical protein [Candidatus Bathyarchaeota archaeon]